MNDNFKNEINFSKDELVRYSRQITLPEFGIESHQLLFYALEQGVWAHQLFYI